MNRLTTVAMLTAAGIVLLPVSAGAKGATAAVVEGIGMAAPLTIGGTAEPGGGDGRTLNRLAQASGLFHALFNQGGADLAPKSPSTDLGPKYSVSYTFPVPEDRNAIIRQDLYPLARPVPVTYTEPGQPLFEGEETSGGWYRSSSRLATVLEKAGVPLTEARTVAARAGATSAAPDRAVAVRWALLPAAGAGMALVVLRRRSSRLAKSRR